MSESGIYKKQPYLQFFELSHEPFPVAPDNRNFFISRHTDQIVKNISKSILYRKGFVLLIGEVGLGKTTLSRRIMDLIEEQGVETSLILQSFYQGTDLLKEINKDFGIDVAGFENLAELMGQLTDFLLIKNKDDINCAIIIDDAQNLSCESLELIRMISNLEADRKKLVQILLVGQPELMGKLNSYTLRQLKSRITILEESLPLEKSELASYINFKLKMAGDTGKIILGKNIVNKLYKITSGNLRMVNILMDRALEMAFLNRSFTINAKFIENAYYELKFKTKPEPKANLNQKFKYFTIDYLYIIIIVISLFMAGLAVNDFLNLRKSGRNIFNNSVKQNIETFIITKPIPLRKIIPSEKRSLNQSDNS